jgi:hypothetical protein
MSPPRPSSFTKSYLIPNYKSKFVLDQNNPPQNLTLKFNSPIKQANNTQSQTKHPPPPFQSRAEPKKKNTSKREKSHTQAVID